MFRFPFSSASKKLTSFEQILRKPQPASATAKEKIKNRVLHEFISSHHNCSFDSIIACFQKPKTPSAFLRSQMKSRILRAFRDRHDTASVSLTEKVSDFFHSFSRMFQLGIVSALSLGLGIFFFPMENKNDEIMFSEIFSDTFVEFPQYAGIMEESEEDLAFFALLEGFEISMETTENLNIEGFSFSNVTSDQQ